MAFYFPPQPSGIESIGAALAAGIDRGLAMRQQRAREEEERRRYEEQQQRLARAEAVAGEERAHQRQREALADRLAGITRTPGGQTVQAVAPQAPAPAVRGIAGGPAVTRQPEAPAPQQVSRFVPGEGVLDLGGGDFYDPRQSQQYALQRLATEEQQRQLDAERQRRFQVATEAGVDPVRAAMLANEMDFTWHPVSQAEQRAEAEWLANLQANKQIQVARARASQGGEEGGGLTPAQVLAYKKYAGSQVATTVQNMLLTGQARNEAEAAQKIIESGHPMLRYLSPEEVATAATVGATAAQGANIRQQPQVTRSFYTPPNYFSRSAPSGGNPIAEAYGADPGGDIDFPARQAPSGENQGQGPTREAAASLELERDRARWDRLAAGLRARKASEAQIIQQLGKRP